jgi:phage gp36-like protein
VSYASQQNLIDRMGEAAVIALTDRGAQPLGAIDMAVVARALAEADAVVDGYLAARYRLPLASTPALLADLATSIALWKLHASTPEDKVKADYDAAIKSLRDIASGMLRIPDAAGIEAEVSGASGVEVVDRERPFTAENMGIHHHPAAGADARLRFGRGGGGIGGDAGRAAAGMGQAARACGAFGPARRGGARWRGRLCPGGRAQLWGLP